MDHVVVDVEIQKTVEETPGGWDATDKLGVAVAVVYEYLTQRFRIYGPNDVPALQERLLAADRISGFNIVNFDFPCIWAVDKQTWLSGAAGSGLKSQLTKKSNDMLRRIWLSLGHDPDKFERHTHGGWSLNVVAAVTLGSEKIGHGADAPKKYQAGDVQWVANYCCDDVGLERDLTDFVDRYGYVLRNPRGGGLQKLQILACGGQ